MDQRYEFVALSSIMILETGDYAFIKYNELETGEYAFIKYNELDTGLCAFMRFKNLLTTVMTWQQNNIQKTFLMNQYI